MNRSVIVRRLGRVDYQNTYQAMASFTTQRDKLTRDEIWYLQHPAVYTLGLAGKRQHILDAGQIPVQETDRGGQVTYHGPGQLIVYLLLDLRRMKMGIKDYVYLLEQSLIDYLMQLGLSAARRPGAPGVYIDGRKIAALGIRVRRGCCYHGLALNVNMDLSPFKDINPCGYPELKVVQVLDFGVTKTIDELGEGLLQFLLKNIIGEPYNVIFEQDLADIITDYYAK